MVGYLYGDDMVHPNSYHKLRGQGVANEARLLILSCSWSAQRSSLWRNSSSSSRQCRCSCSCSFFSSSSSNPHLPPGLHHLRHR